MSTKTISHDTVETATVKDLRTFAKVLGVSIPRGATKSAIYDLLFEEMNSLDDQGVYAIEFDEETLEVLEDQTIEDSEVVTLDVDADTISITVEYLPTKALKYHWANLGVYAAKKFAADFGLKETHNSDKYTVTLTAGKSREDALVAAADLLVKAWATTHEAFVSWRKTDEAFRAMPAMTSSRWASSERYLAERAWLNQAIDNFTGAVSDLI